MSALSCAVQSRLCLVTCVMTIWWSPSVWAQKTDTVLMNNGDRITVEIKRVERGRLQASTDGMGTVYIEWDDIDQLTSKARFEVEVRSGQRFVGSLEATNTIREVLVRSDQPVTIQLDRVVTMTPVNQRFWRQWDGNIDLGYNFAKAGESTQLTVSSRVTRRAERLETSVFGDSFFSAKEGAENTSRHSAGLSFLRHVGQRWGLTALGQFDRNDELQLALRSLVGAGYVRTVLQSPVVTLRAMGAAVVNREEFLDETAGQNNVEAAFGADFQWFTYDTPKTDLTMTFVVFPNLSDWGRTRLELDVRVRRELVSDLFFSVSFQDSFDSDPPSESAARNDFNVVSSFGWSF